MIRIHCVEKLFRKTDRNNIRKGGFISAHSLGDTVCRRKAWQLEWEVTGHIVSSARKQREVDAGNSSLWDNATHRQGQSSLLI